MASVNQFYPFGTAGGSYTLTNAQYQALALRSTGFPAGIVLKENLNTALRQSSFVAAAWSQWIADTALVSVNDDGVIANYKAQIIQALNLQIQGQLNLGFIAYAGNPNGHVAGVQGNPGTQFPTVVWDTTNKLWWVCTTTGTTLTAAWTESGATPAWPFWCGTNTGTGNAPVLAPPASMAALVSGGGVSWKVAANNTGAVSVTITGFGTFALDKDGPAGPAALAGGELIAGNIVSARYDGTVLHLTATEMGSAALANASSNTGTVVAAVGAFTPGHVLVANDVAGSAVDGGPPGAATPAVYIDNSSAGATLTVGSYLVSTAAAAFAINLPPTPTNGQTLIFTDVFGNWDRLNFTINRNGNTINFSADNLVCNVVGETLGLCFDTVNNTWRLF